MQDIELYTKILGISKPWTVSSVEVSIPQKRVTITVIHDKGTPARCPECGLPASIHDNKTRRWRHLDTCQMETIIECRVPRSSCTEHGGRQLKVPWAEANSHFTAMFEALVIDWLKQANISAVSKLLGLSWDEAAYIQERAVRRGLARRKESVVKKMAIDETSFQKRHEYVTVILDRERDVGIEVLDDRKADTVGDWLASKNKVFLSGIETISMDMWDPFIKAITDNVPEAKRKICFDRFHVAQHFGKAVDKVRAMEHRELSQKPKGSPLKKTKMDWLRNSHDIDNRSRRQFLELTRKNLRTARAWAIKETAAGLWNYSYRGAAEKAWKLLLRWIAKCRLAPVIKVGKMVAKYFWGICNAIIQKVSNAIAEGKNARIQKIKAMACGFRNRARFKMAILFHLGGLDMSPSVPMLST